MKKTSTSLLISDFKSVYDKPGLFETLEKVFNRFRSGEYHLREKIEYLRQLLSEGEIDMAKKYKTDVLGGVTFAGIFNKNRSSKNLEQASGYAIFDFDKVEDPEELKTMLFNNHKFVKMATISPSGNGVKVLARIPVVESNEEYKQYYMSLLNGPFNIASKDVSNSDISRLCFNTYDPDIKVRDDKDVEVWTKKYIKPVKEKSEKQDSTIVNTENSPMYYFNENCIEDAKTILLDSGWSCSNRTNNLEHWTRPGKDSGTSATFGCGGNEWLFYCFSNNADPFEANTSYSPYDILALLCYDNNHKEAYRGIIDEYGLKESNNRTDDYYSKQDEVFSSTMPELQIPNTVSNENSNEFTMDFSESNIRMNENRKPVSLFDKYAFDPNAPRPDLETIMMINDIDVFNLGDISLLTGHAKSRKTFFTTYLAYAASISNSWKQKNTDIIKFNLPIDRPKILYFDTEQSIHYVGKIADRIKYMNGNLDRIFFYRLREASVKERFQMLEKSILQHPDASLIIIDGIKDLMFDFNNVKESSELTTLLMQVSNKYNVHIFSVLHTNKERNGEVGKSGRGHLGTEMQNKAEIVMNITIDRTGEKNYSVVTNYLGRNKPFQDLNLVVDENAIPGIISTGERSIMSDINYTKVRPEFLSSDMLEKLVKEIKIGFSKKGKEIKKNSVIQIILNSAKQIFGEAISERKAEAYFRYFKLTDVIKNNGRETGAGVRYTFNDPFSVQVPIENDTDFDEILSKL